jgi:hypothetical protein
MHTDTLTPEFIALFVALLVIALLLFPAIDFAGSWRARREKRARLSGGSAFGKGKDRPNQA